MVVYSEKCTNRLIVGCKSLWVKLYFKMVWRAQGVAEYEKKDPL